MKAGLLEKIRSRGYWRVNFRPLAPVDEPILLTACRRAVEQSSVSIRGWDYPHISRKNDDEGGYTNSNEFVENWTDWYGFEEFWRLYQSTQFISFNSLREDTRPDEHGNPKVPILNTVGTLYAVTEFFEFAARLWSHGLYQSGVEVIITLGNAQGRILQAGHGRVPFWDRLTTSAEKIEVRKSLDPSKLSGGQKGFAIRSCVEIFDKFGWSPDPSQLEADQERFYRRDWSY